MTIFIFQDFQFSSLCVNPITLHATLSLPEGRPWRVRRPGSGRRVAPCVGLSGAGGAQGNDPSSEHKSNMMYNHLYIGSLQKGQMKK